MVARRCASLGGGVATALAASPDPTLRPGSDTRTSGGGPGLVGDPLLALLGVLGIAAVSVIATLAYVRFTAVAAARDRRAPPRYFRPIGKKCGVVRLAP